MEDCIFKFVVDHDKKKLLEESKVFQYQPINKDTLTWIYNEGLDYNDDMSFIEKNNKWWTEQRSWNASREPKVTEFDLSESRRLTSLFKKICETDTIKANFLTQTQGSEVPVHTDVGTLCAINFILEGEQTPINFEGHADEYYDVALLNVSINHSVPVQKDQDRILFKLRFTHNTFDEIKEKIKNNYPLRSNK
tara:strand:+ start:2326 stop:2904 length:579 start_codon:yes stop_codon:yes gene_type:complete